MKSLLAGDKGPPIPTRCVRNKLAIFSALEAGFYRNSFVLRNLESKFLKTANLRELVCEMERKATPRVYTGNTPLKTG
jgi:hypothetical protein